MNEVMINKQTEKMVTTQELAEVLGVSTKTIERAAAKKGIDSTVLPFNTNGGIQKKRCFNEKQATLIKQEIQSHHNLQSRKIDTVSTEIEENELILQAQQILTNRIYSLKKQLEEQQPKVEYYDTLCDSSNLVEIGVIGKQTGIGSNNIFKKLQEDKIIFRKTDGNGRNYYVPYADYEKYFKLVQYSYTRDDEICSYYTLKVNQKGVMWLTRRYSKELNNKEVV